MRDHLKFLYFFLLLPKRIFIKEMYRWVISLYLKIIFIIYLDFIYFFHIKVFLLSTFYIILRIYSSL